MLLSCHADKNSIHNCETHQATPTRQPDSLTGLEMSGGMKLEAGTGLAPPPYTGTTIFYLFFKHLLEHCNFIRNKKKTDSILNV